MRSGQLVDGGNRFGDVPGSIGDVQLLVFVMILVMKLMDDKFW